MTSDTSPGPMQSAEPKRCVGIYFIDSFAVNTLLTDTGMRFYIDPKLQKLRAWGFQPNEHDEAHDWLNFLASRDDTMMLTPDAFLTWCLDYANPNGLIGSRAFANPHRLTLEGLNPSSMSITEECAQQGM